MSSIILLNVVNSVKQMVTVWKRLVSGDPALLRVCLIDHPYLSADPSSFRQPHCVHCPPRSHHLSLPIPSTPDLKLISFTNAILHTVVTLIPSGLTSWILTCLATCARLSCILSFRVHVKLCYRIVSYRSVSWSNLAPFTITLWNRTGTFWGYPANRPTDKQTFRTKT